MKSEIVELLELITEEQIKKLGYKNFSYMKEASLHSTWRPRLIIINENDEKIIIYHRGIVHSFDFNSFNRNS